MKKLRHYSILAACLVGGLVVWSTPAPAETISQTNLFAYETPISGSANITVVTPSFFTASFNPWTFYGASNELDSFTITWDITVGASGVVPGPNPGGFSGNCGGQYEVDGHYYNQNVGNPSGFSSVAATISQSVPVDDTETFLVSEANHTYDPAILSAIMTGPDLNWNADYNLDFGGLSSGEASVEGSVVLSYTTTSVPEPGSMALGGVGSLALLVWRLRRGAAA